MRETAALRELVDLNELQAIQDSFAKTVGTSSVIFSPEGEPLTQFSNPTGFCALIQSTEKGKRRCFLSFMEISRKALELEEPKIFYCFAQCCHYAAPIIIDGEHKGMMFAGQFIPQKFSAGQLKALEKIAREINVDPNLLEEEAKKMRVVEEALIRNYSSLLLQVVEVITRLGAQATELGRAKDAVQKAHNGLEILVQERTAELGKTVEDLRRERKRAEEQAMATQNLLDDLNEEKNKLAKSRHAILNMVLDLETEKRETESAKHALEAINIKLERSNKELQDFTYIASHDLREPLRKISAFGQLLHESLKGKLDEDEEENFAFMIDGATRMQQMVNDLLVYSRVTTKAKPPELVDLNAVIDDLKDVELAVQVEEAGGVINVPEPLPHVQADPSQMHQLLQNLIGNGLKYRRKGVAPVITVRSRQNNGKNVRIEVQDNGIGIKKESYANIFGMFKRLHSQEEYEGSGIGLAVCKKIVERHGGEIGVESNLGEGSTFWFTIPITLPVTGGEVEIERNRWDLMFDILREISVTEGVQKTNLDLASVKRYFEFLMDNDFLEAGDEPGKDECYKLTEKGQDLLLKLQDVAAMVRGMG